METAPTEPSYGAPPPQPDRPLAAPTPIWKRIGGGIAAAGVALAKWGAILLKLKVFTFAASMLVSVAAYAWLWGWQFGVGFVLLIFVHEMGHVIALRRMGIRASAPMFIPFLGAFVSMKEQPRSAWHEAVSGIAGPAFGALAAAACWWYAHESGSRLFLALAFTGFFLNLFNLIPMLPLDGGRAAAAIHPAMWLVGLAGLIGLLIYHPNVLIMIILLLGGTEAWRRFRGRQTAEGREYYKLTSRQRQLMTLAYFGLIAILVLAMHQTYVHRSFS
ncbi:MAG: site-2 protease family protein [Actinomycetes bacterium]